MLTYEHHKTLANIFKTIKKSKYSITKLKILLKDQDNQNILAQLVNKDFIIKTTKSVQLTNKGIEKGYQNLRIISVLKIFSTEILGLSNKEADNYIKNIFFAINNLVLEKYCALLGHSSKNNFPPGECCLRAQKETSEKIIPLNKLPLNTTASISYIKTVNAPNMQKLYDLGIIPGEELKILQLYPTYIISLNEEQIALDEEAAALIFVKK